MVLNCRHGDTKKALVRGTISYLESQGLPVNKTAIFKHFELTRSQGYAAINTPSSLRNDPEWEERRGRPSKISDEDQQKMENVLWDTAFEDVSLNWQGLARHAGLGIAVTKRTLHRTMGTLGYRRCIGCGRSSVNIKAREKRVEWARKMLETMPSADDWKSVRFSYELHFGFGLDGAMRVLPRLGEKFCPPCEACPTVEKWARDVRRVHAWAAVGYGFKSDLVFYDDATHPHSTGLLSMDDYRDKILHKVVKTWLGPSNGGSQPFTLHEDFEAFAHGGLSKTNPVQEWKDAVGLKYHFNCGDCPDLSPLDSLWPPSKRWKMEEPVTDWDEATLRAVARRAWSEVVLSQDRVNMWVEYMPARLREVVNSEGRMIPW